MSLISWLLLLISLAFGFLALFCENSLSATSSPNPSTNGLLAKHKWLPLVTPSLLSNASATTSFSLWCKVQVLYTRTPPTRTKAAAAQRICSYTQHRRMKYHNVRLFLVLVSGDRRSANNNRIISNGSRIHTCSAGNSSSIFSSSSHRTFGPLKKRKHKIINSNSVV